MWKIKCRKLYKIRSKRDMPEGEKQMRERYNQIENIMISKGFEEYGTGNETAQNKDIQDMRYFKGEKDIPFLKIQVCWEFEPQIKAYEVYGTEIEGIFSSLSEAQELLNELKVSIVDIEYI